MKKFYLLFICFLYFIINEILRGLNISGYLYNLIMIILLVYNWYYISKNKADFKYNKTAFIISFLLIFIPKDFYNFLFIISLYLNIIIINFKKSKFIMITSIINSFLLFIIIPIYLLIFLLDAVGWDMIYEDSHYYCNDNYEIYMYSAGAMDSYHFYTGRHFEIININKILKVEYNRTISEEKEKYYNISERKICKLASDKNGQRKNS